MTLSPAAVVPGYYLVCYNSSCKSTSELIAVVPGYYLVCYNRKKLEKNENQL